MSLFEFIEWAARTGNPVRASDGTIQVWNADTNSFDEIEGWTTDSLYVGEVGADNISIRESVTHISQEFTANGVSHINFEVWDPDFKMHNNNYFMLDRTVFFNGLSYRTTQVTVNHTLSGHIIKVKAEPANMVRLQQDKGAANFGAISPTQFASQKAAEFGMRFFGESSPAGEAIIRKFDDTSEESTWDVLKRLASELEFSVFEANNQLFFSSDEYLIANQPTTAISIPSKDDDLMDVITFRGRRSSDMEYAAELDFTVRKNKFTTSLFPGAGLTINGCGNLDQHIFMIERASMDVDPGSLVSINARAVDANEEEFCSQITLERGDVGVCVKRLQRALNVQETGEYGPYTEQKVKDFQELFELPITGIITPTDWALIEFIT